MEKSKDWNEYNKLHINEQYNQIKWTNLCRGKNWDLPKSTKKKSKSGWEIRLETQIKKIYKNRPKL